MDRKEEIKKELRTIGNPFSDKARYLREELKMLKNIDKFYESSK